MSLYDLGMNMGLRLALMSLALLGALLAPPVTRATSVLEMNLAFMADRSEMVFRGTVMEVSETSVQGGGGTLPAIVYTFRVDDALKGTYDEIKGERVVQVRMIGSLKQYHASTPPIEGFPLLKTGGDYLLMIAPPGPLGLTSPMGLGQGAFTVYTDPNTRQEMALNGLNNKALFKGMAKNLRAAGKSVPTDGPVAYDTLADMIRSTVGE